MGISSFQLPEVTLDQQTRTMLSARARRRNPCKACAGRPCHPQRFGPHGANEWHCKFRCRAHDRFGRLHHPAFDGRHSRTGPGRVLARALRPRHASRRHRAGTRRAVQRPQSLALAARLAAPRRLVIPDADRAPQATPCRRQRRRRGGDQPHRVGRHRVRAVRTARCERVKPSSSPEPSHLRSAEPASDNRSAFVYRGAHSKQRI